MGKRHSSSSIKRTNMKLKMLGEGLDLLISLSLLTVGFSSFIITNDSNLTFNVNPPEFTYIDFENSCQYILNSEDGFDFYNFNNRRYYTDTTFSLRGKCRPDLIKMMYSSMGASVIFGITYSYYTLEGYEIFKEDNNILGVPDNFKCSLETSENRFLYSDDLIYHKSESINETTYTIEGSILLYSDTEPCLYSLTKDYQTGTNYVYFNIDFDFENLDLNNDSIFPKLTFNFITNLEGARS